MSDAASARVRFDEIVGTSGYMTIATADPDGAPWASPVWFASADGVELLWMSAPGARHSRNIAVRPEVAIAIFDSRQPPGTGAGAYVAASAEEVPAGALDAAVDTFSQLSVAGGASAVGSADVQAPARHRFYRAVARERYVLSARDERVPVE
jgi:hypothetical protein